MGEKLPNEPQPGDLNANTAGREECDTLLFKFPGRNLESNKTSKKRNEKIKNKNVKVILNSST